MLNHSVHSHKDNILGNLSGTVVSRVHKIHKHYMILHELIKSLDHDIHLSSALPWAPDFSLLPWFTWWPLINKPWPQFLNLKD